MPVVAVVMAHIHALNPFLNQELGICPTLLHLACNVTPKASTLNSETPEAQKRSHEDSDLRYLPGQTPKITSPGHQALSSALETVLLCIMIMITVT